MNYLQKKKLAFMSIVNRVKGFIKTVIGSLPLTLTNCVDNNSLIDYKLHGNSIQDGTPTPDAPIEVESVGEYDEESGKYKVPITVSNDAESITTNIYLDEPLRKVGDYADYIDFENGKVVRYIQKYTFTGTEEFQRRSSYSNKTTKYSLSDTLERYVGISCMSNIGDFENGTNANATGETGVGLYVDNKTASRIVYIEVPYKYNTVESLNEYLSTNKVYVMYPLATPTETPVNLPIIPTFKGSTILTVDTTIQPRNAEVTYYSTSKE